MPYNVQAIGPDGSVFIYLGTPVATRQEAEKHMQSYCDKYQGKPYPNGRGFYPVCIVSIIEVPELSAAERAWWSELDRLTKGE